MTLTSKFLEQQKDTDDEKPQDDDQDKSISENVSTIIDTATALPGQMVDLATGSYKQLEFPDAKETTQIEDVGFFESLLPNIKMMFSRNDIGKAEIIADTFKGDERFGGVAVDKFQNPFIVWNNERYYINKPGVSRQDVGTLVGEIIKYLPASKLVGGTKTVTGKIATGIPSYTATEGVGEVIESALTPKTTRADKRTMVDKGVDALKMGTLGTAIDIVTPPILRAPVEAVKGATRVGARALDQPIPEFAKKGIDNKSVFLQTQGQRTSEPFDPKKGTATAQASTAIAREDIIRNAPNIDPIARALLRGLDERQIGQIRETARELQKELGSGTVGSVDSANVPLSAIDSIKNIVIPKSRELKKVAGEGFEYVQNVLNPPIVSQKGIRALAENMQKIIKEEFQPTLTGANTLDDMPLLQKEILNIQKLAKIDTDKPFQQLAASAKALNNRLRTATPGTPEARILGILKGELDDFIFRGIDQGFINGNEGVINALKQSNELYKQYIGLVGKKQTGDKAEQATNAILQKLSNPGFDASNVVNAFFGNAKFQPAPVMANVLKRFKAGLPPEKYDEVIALIKDAVIEKAFAGKGTSDITRTNIVKNFNEVFGRNKQYIKELFTDAEIKKIKNFRDNVMPTLWAEISLNPSGSGYLIASAAAETGILNYIKLLPGMNITGLKDTIEGVQRIGDINEAKDMIKQYITRADKPLFDFPLPGIKEGKLTLQPKGVFIKQATTVEPREEIIGTEEVDASAIKPLVESISQKNIEKVLQAIQR